MNRTYKALQQREVVLVYLRESAGEREEGRIRERREGIEEGKEQRVQTSPERIGLSTIMR
jgi:hypothetical protein